MSSKPIGKRKKTAKRQVVTGQIHIHASFNNTIITVSDSQGNTLVATSSGACGFRGTKKGTAYAAQVAVEKVVGLAKNNFGLKTVDVFLRGIGQGRDASIRALAANGLEITALIDKTTIAHGGVRPRRARRV